MFKIEFENETSSDDESGGPSEASKKRKHPSTPWRNVFLTSKNKSKDTVIEISDSDSTIAECSDSDFEIPKKKQKQSVSNTSTFISGHQSRRILDYDELDAETKEAKIAEKQSILQRKERDLSLAKLYDSPETASSSTDIVLDINASINKKIVIHNQLAKLLKPHQIDGIKHMYNCCYGSVDKFKTDKNKGSGCILAHCMGLGKTLQLIALLHTVIQYPEFATNRILILCPKSTLSNWKAEINKWIGSIRKTRCLKVFEFSDSRTKDQQMDKLTIWSRYSQKNQNAACFLMSYESFRSLVYYGQQKNKKNQTQGNKNSAKEERIRDVVQQSLLNATDLIVCDEGHMIKNLDSTTNRAVTQLKTRRRIVLTGTPMQNNLMEYYAMVNFVKPSFLGTPKEFRNIYANPIQKGQHRDSTSFQTRLMRMQSFNLNRELESFVHRREVSFLMKELPGKLEYVLYIPMSEKQTQLYEYYLVENPYTVNSKKLFTDYNALRKIWTHPKQLEISYDKAVKRNTNIVTQATLKAAKYSYEDGDVSDSNENLTTSMTQDWWRPFVTDEELNSILLSPKFEVMFEILKECERRSEKCLIFSTSVICLNIVEFFLKAKGSWKPERDYFRLDGSTKNFQRNRMIVEFNKPQNAGVKAFLISAKAGGQGINLTAANRIILLDTSWNPAVDQQSIFRIFRFGQQKNCYVYRLLSMGTMEEKIYSRSVTKQAMAFRVIDKQQIDRNYSMAELGELYTFSNPKLNVREIPIPPKDELLSHLLNKFPDKVFKYHKHESLLDNKYEEDMTEEEKQEAMLIHDINKNKKKSDAMAMASTARMDPIDPTDYYERTSNGTDLNYLMQPLEQVLVGRDTTNDIGVAAQSNTYEKMIAESRWNAGYLNAYQNMLPTSEWDPAYSNAYRNSLLTASRNGYQPNALQNISSTSPLEKNSNAYRNMLPTSEWDPAYSNASTSLLEKNSNAYRNMLPTSEWDPAYSNASTSLLEKNSNAYRNMLPTSEWDPAYSNAYQNTLLTAGRNGYQPNALQNLSSTSLLGKNSNVLPTSSYASQKEMYSTQPSTSFIGKRKGSELGDSRAKKSKINELFS